MPVAMAVFFAARLSFAPVLRMIPFADLLAFFDEDLDFLRLAFFMDSSRSTGFVQLGSFLRSVARTVSPAYRERGPAADGNPRYAPSAMSIRSALLSFAKTKPSLSRRGSALHLCHCRSRGGARSVPARYTSPCAGCSCARGRLAAHECRGRSRGSGSHVPAWNSSHDAAPSREVAPPRHNERAPHPTLNRAAQM
jgi:hypothetical protein